MPAFVLPAVVLAFELLVAVPAFVLSSIALVFVVLPSVVRAFVLMSVLA
jgi:hypothetical protein